MIVAPLLGSEVCANVRYEMQPASNKALDWLINIEITLLLPRVECLQLQCEHRTKELGTMNLLKTRIQHNMSRQTLETLTQDQPKGHVEDRLDLEFL